MRRPVLNLGLAALTLSSMVPLFAADAPAATSSAAPMPVSAPAPIAAPATSTQTATSETTASAAPAASTAPAAVSAAAATTAVAPAPATEPAPTSAPAAQAAVPPQAQPEGVPVRGMNMANVEHIFGAPIEKYDAVGKPPITRWDYPDYVVYFEYNMVLHTVMKNQPNG